MKQKPHVKDLSDLDSEMVLAAAMGMQHAYPALGKITVDTANDGKSILLYGLSRENDIALLQVMKDLGIDSEPYLLKEKVSAPAHHSKDFKKRAQSLTNTKARSAVLTQDRHVIMLPREQIETLMRNVHAKIYPNGYPTAQPKAVALSEELPAVEELAPAPLAAISEPAPPIALPEPEAATEEQMIDAKAWLKKCSEKMMAQNPTLGKLDILLGEDGASFAVRTLQREMMPKLGTLLNSYGLNTVPLEIESVKIPKLPENFTKLSDAARMELNRKLREHPEKFEQIPAAFYGMPIAVLPHLERMLEKRQAHMEKQEWLIAHGAATSGLEMESIADQKGAMAFRMLSALYPNVAAIPTYLPENGTNNRVSTRGNTGMAGALTENGIAFKLIKPPKNSPSKHDVIEITAKDVLKLYNALLPMIPHDHALFARAKNMGEDIKEYNSCVNAYEASKITGANLFAKKATIAPTHAQTPEEIHAPLEEKPAITVIEPVVPGIVGAIAAEAMSAPVADEIEKPKPPIDYLSMEQGSQLVRVGHNLKQRYKLGDFECEGVTGSDRFYLRGIQASTTAALSKVFDQLDIPYTSEKVGIEYKDHLQKFFKQSAKQVQGKASSQLEKILHAPQTINILVLHVDQIAALESAMKALDAPQKEAAPEPVIPAPATVLPVVALAQSENPLDKATLPVPPQKPVAVAIPVARQRPKPPTPQTTMPRPNRASEFAPKKVTELHPSQVVLLDSAEQAMWLMLAELRRDQHLLPALHGDIEDAIGRARENIEQELLQENRKARSSLAPTPRGPLFQKFFEEAEQELKGYRREDAPMEDTELGLRHYKKRLDAHRSANGPTQGGTADNDEWKLDWGAPLHAMPDILPSDAAFDAKESETNDRPKPVHTASERDRIEEKLAWVEQATDGQTERHQAEQRQKRFMELANRQLHSVMLSHRNDSALGL